MPNVRQAMSDLILPVVDPCPVGSTALEKVRFPRTEALEVARELCAALKPACERIIVAGSLRRKKPSVGDVEILFVPRFEMRMADMFEKVRVSVADEVISTLVSNGRLSTRPSKLGSVSWGPKNKLARHHGGIPVDLFTATDENWWNYLVCRTGPADSNARIARHAQDRGYKWNPYGSGFTRLSDGVVIPMESERAVFDFVRLPYREPADRI